MAEETTPHQGTTRTTTTIGAQRSAFERPPSGAERIAYVDVDVHHGDGVEAAFWDDPRAHRWRRPVVIEPGQGEQVRSIKGRREGR